jgi:Zn-dependent M28 family amino/carboxypeptidase
MRKSIALSAFLIFGKLLSAQPSDTVINALEVGRIEGVLAADDMQGRAVFTPGIEKAAGFIAHEFKAAGLLPLSPNTGYRQDFTLLRIKSSVATGAFGGASIDPNHILVFSSAAEKSISSKDGYEKSYIRPGDNLFMQATRNLQSKKNTLVLVDTSFAQNFSRLANRRRQQFNADRTVVFVLASTDPSEYEFHIKQEIAASPLANMVGILPGKSRKNEFVIFSGHYDHLGIGKPNNQGDSIFNGANDDASGTTAVLLLAKYFSRLGNNERTLVFATFTAEEIGEYGSQYFSLQFDPEKVVAMFNIEMIGTESKWGRNSAYITGYERSDMGTILEKNLEGSPFHFYPDPYPQQQLFYRSDNATLARQGVPAHTLSTSKMDSEKYYHTVGDEISTLDLRNMAEIIRSIAISSTSIVSGKDTPTRVDTSQLR